MTILALAYNSLKALDKLFSSRNVAVEHLSDHLLNDIGLYRDAGEILNLNNVPNADQPLTEKKDSKARAVFIPSPLEDSGG